MFFDTFWFNISGILRTLTPPLDAVSTLEASCLTLKRRKKCTPPLSFTSGSEILYSS